MSLLGGPYIPCFFQVQGCRDDNDDKNNDDEQDRIVKAGYELRDVKSLRYTVFSAPSGGRDGAV